MSTFAAALPHGPLTRVADGVFAVRGRFRMRPGMTISRTMTVLDSGDGLVVLNAVRLSDAGHSELDALGKVKHLVKLSDSHGIDEPFYTDRYAPQTWGKANDKPLTGEGPIGGGVVVELTGTSGWRECAYWTPLGGGTLVTCDAIQNCADTEGASFMARSMMPFLGFKGGVIQPAMWRRLQKVPPPKIRTALAGLAPLAFENLITGHGPPVAGGADKLVRAAIDRVAT
jgi:hypothetical protein